MLAIPTVINAGKLPELFDCELIEGVERLDVWRGLRLTRRLWFCVAVARLLARMEPCEFVDDVADELEEINKGSNEQLNRMSGVHWLVGWLDGNDKSIKSSAIWVERCWAQSP